MAVLLRVSPQGYGEMKAGSSLSRRLSLPPKVHSVSMKHLSGSTLFPTIQTISVPTLKPVVGRAGSSAGVYMCLNAAEFNQRVHKVVAEFNIGPSPTTPPSLTFPSKASHVSTAVNNIARHVVEYLTFRDEQIMLQLKNFCNVHPRFAEYLEVYALLLDKFKVLEKGNKFLVSFGLFVSIIMFFGSLLSYIAAATFDHTYYGAKLIEIKENRSECIAAGSCERDDLKPPLLFKVAEIIKILFGLGSKLIKWVYEKIKSCSVLPLLQFLKSIIKEVKDMMKAGDDGDE